MSGERADKNSALTAHFEQTADRVTDERQQLIEHVRSGGTTGNQLHDDLIRWIGNEAFDEETIRFFETVNEAITDKHDELFVVKLSDTSYSEPKGCFGSGHITDGYDYIVYGVLTGEPLTYDEELGLYIPCIDSARLSGYKTALSFHDSDLGAFMVDQIDKAIRAGGSKSVLMSAFWHAGASSKLDTPDFQVATGVEAVEEVLNSSEHLRFFGRNVNKLQSILELYQRLGGDYPMPSTIAHELEIMKIDLLANVEGRTKRAKDLQEDLDQLEAGHRSKVSKLRDEIADTKDRVRAEKERVLVLDQILSPKE